VFYLFLQNKSAILILEVKKQSVQSKIRWFLIALGVTVALAPNATVTRWLLGSWDPYFLSFIRSLLAALLCVPLVVKYRRNLRGRGLVYGLLASVMMAISVLCFIVSLNMQEASLVGLISLLTPIVLVYYSAKVNHEKITRAAKLGVGIAIIGALVMFLGDVGASESMRFHLIPVLLGLAYCLTYPLATVYYKKANDEGVHLVALVSLGVVLSAGLNAVIWLMNGARLEHSFSVASLGGLLYIILVVALYGKFLNIRSYEHVGSGVMGSLYYLQSVLAVVLPLFFLHENIRLITLVGGAVILLGVWVTEYHYSPHAKHHRIFHIT
jgi:drug/metabolite transporter (DMT)-like permease